MTGDSKKHRFDLEGTDELPVLSEEAILAFDPEETVPGRPAAQGMLKFVALDSPVEADEALTASDAGLEHSVDQLRGVLESAERRWRSLEFKLEAQDRAIAELKAFLGALNERPRRAEPTVPRAVRADSSKAVAGDAEAPRAGARSRRSDMGKPITRTEQPMPAEHGTGEAESGEAGLKPAAGSAAAPRRRAENALLERIAALESYIAGRADRWREMEEAVAAKSLRVAELEIELEQRISREQNLEQRIHDEGLRSHELRDKLNALNKRFEDLASASADRTLEPTQPSMRAPPSANAAPEARQAVAQAGASELVCLTSDQPERHVLDKSEITIGRGPECDIRVPTHFVSREHARIRRENGALVIEDRSSTNGVFVNAVRVDRKKLEHGDWITIGETQFRFLSSAAGAPK